MNILDELTKIFNPMMDTPEASPYYEGPGDNYLRAPEQPGIRRATPQEAHTARRIKVEDYGQGIQSPDFLDPVDILSDPGFLKSLAKLAGGAGMAGMIRMGGKEFPNAMFLRSIEVPTELRNLTRLWGLGKSSSMPATINTPSVLGSFEERPYGLLFHGKEPSDIRQISSFDMASLPKTERLYVRQSEALEERQDYIRRLLAGKSGQWNDPRYPKAENYGDRKRYRKALDELHTWYSPDLEHWEAAPTTGRPLLDPMTQTLTDLFNDQARIQKGTKALVSNEAIISMSPENLAGVRFPLEHPSKYYDDIREALESFARKYNVPTYRWPNASESSQLMTGLEHPFAGKWGYKPGSRDYITSSMLKKIFGIGMEDLP